LHDNALAEKIIIRFVKNFSAKAISQIILIIPFLDEMKTNLSRMVYV
jgi:hypothetical protein